MIFAYKWSKAAKVLTDPATYTVPEERQPVSRRLTPSEARVADAIVAMLRAAANGTEIELLPPIVLVHITHPERVASILEWAKNLTNFGLRQSGMSNPEEIALGKASEQFATALDTYVKWQRSMAA